MIRPKWSKVASLAQETFRHFSYLLLCVCVLIVFNPFKDWINSPTLYIGKTGIGMSNVTVPFCTKSEMGRKSSKTLDQHSLIYNQYYQFIARRGLDAGIILLQVLAFTKSLV